MSRRGKAVADAALREQAHLLSEARHPDPPSFLGRHAMAGRIELRVFSPHARSLSVSGGPELERVAGTDLFVWQGEASRVPERYELAWTDDAGVAHRRHDAYAFPPLIG